MGERLVIMLAIAFVALLAMGMRLIFRLAASRKRAAPPRPVVKAPSPEPPAPETPTCGHCDLVRSVFEAARRCPHENLAPVHAMLEVLVKRGWLEVYAGDCPFGEMLDVLESELHYTVCFYLRCTRCGTYYFFGACIRGVPVYRVVEDISKESMRGIWGSEGAYFQD